LIKIYLCALYNPESCQYNIAFVEFLFFIVLKAVLELPNGLYEIKELIAIDATKADTEEDIRLAFHR